MKSNTKASLRTAGRLGRQGGITLLEVLISLSIIAMATVGLNMIADRFTEDTQAATAAGQVRTFGEATKAFVKDNYSTVMAQATATTPYLVDVNALVASGKLPAGFLGVTSHQQRVCALVLEPTPGMLQAMVVTEGGQTLGDPTLGHISSIIGGSGAGVYSTNTGALVGAGGGWSVPVASWHNRANHAGLRCDGTAGNVQVTPGHLGMALWFENGDVSSAFVARSMVPGRPELNAMNTPLVMNSVQTEAAVCTTAGAIARDSAGGLLTCKSGTWQAPSAASAACVQDTITSLDNFQDSNRCINGVNNPGSPAGGDWFFLEVFRHPNPANYYVGQRVIGMTGNAAGRVWVRNQLSGTQAGGWTGWNQVSAPGVSAWNDGLGHTWATGDVNAGRNIIARNITYTASDNWAFMAYSSGWGEHTAPQNAANSAYLNDVYLRSVGRWVSQMGRGASQTRAGRNYVGLAVENPITWITVSTTTKYSPADGSHNGDSYFYVYINGGHWFTIYNNVNVGKYGSNGHYWAYENFGSHHENYNVALWPGNTVEVSLVAGNYVMHSDIKLTVSN